jgi:hypothetical protein
VAAANTAAGWLLLLSSCNFLFGGRAVLLYGAVHVTANDRVNVRSDALLPLGALPALLDGAQRALNKPCVVGCCAGRH